MSSTIKTAVRVRPLLPSEIQQKYRNTKLFLNTNKNEVVLMDGSKKNFHCDYLLTPEATQQEVFEKCGIPEMIQKSIQGYHSTIFAYGQTGSGKSHTMQGSEETVNDGLINRIAKCLFSKIKQRSGKCKFSVSVSFIQIYSERIYDLFNPASLNNRTLNLSQGVQGLRLRWNKDQQFTVQNMFVFQCKDENQLSKYVGIGLKNRISSSHKLNVQSSRSHSILSIKIEANEGNTIRTSRIQLVDLAGSQRIGLTGTEGRLAKQSIDINKSLFTLRQVINVLSEGSKSKDEKVYVPYRDSKLTSILKQSIGGNSYCLMIACLTPNDSFIEENLSTLTYATKASFIKNNPTPNLDANTKMIQQLKRQLYQVNEELEKANQQIQLLTSLVEQKPNLQKKLTQKQQTERQHQVEEDLPHPIFKKRISEKINTNYDSNISQRLIQSINMVRQLLKSNKQLRQKLEQTNYTLQDKNAQIFQLTRQNQTLREGRPLFISSETEIKQLPFSMHKTQIKPTTVESRRLSLKVPQPINPINRQPIPQIQLYQASSKRIPAGISLDMGKIYLNEKGIDSAPTNFNKRITNTSQERRQGYSRGSIQEEDRHAITAKFSKRGWLARDGDVKKFLSFYEGKDASGL